MFMHMFRPSLFCMDAEADAAAAQVAAAAEKPKTFTQEQVDTIVSDRLTRKEKNVTDALLTSLGVKDPAEAKAIIEASKKASDAQKSETERLQKEVADFKTAAEKATKEAQDQVTAMQKRILDSELRIAASQAVMGKEKKDGKEQDIVVRSAFKTEALDDVLLLVDRTKITEKDGKYEGIAEALNTLAKAKPYLMAETVAVKLVGKGTPDARKGIKQGEDGPVIKPTVTHL